MRYLVIIFSTLFSLYVSADGLPSGPYVSVVGSASLEVQADQVIVEFEPSAINKSAKLAKEEVDKKVAAVIKNLTHAGFSGDALRIDSQNVRPEYDYQGKQRTLLGVRVSQQLSYRLLDVNRADLLIDRLLAANIVSISSLQYGLQDPNQWHAQVRDSAVLDSTNKAQALAKAYQAKLGKVYSINYANNSARPVFARSMAMESKGNNVKPKTITISDRVNTVFELLP